MTVRLPKALKDQLEAAAGSAGDSINSYVVKSLSTPSAKAASPSSLHRDVRDMSDRHEQFSVGDRPSGGGQHDIGRHHRS